MKKFLLNVLLFLIPLYAVAWLADGVITRAMRKSQAGNVRVWDDVVSGNVNSDIVIYGTSRALNHFDTRIISDSLHTSAYNLGLTSHNFLMVNCRHDVLLKYNKAPKLIIISADVFLLDKRKDLFDYQYLTPFINETEICATTKKYVGFDIYDYYLPLVRYTGYTRELKAALAYLINHKRPTQDVYPRGYHSLDGTWNGEFEMKRKNGVIIHAHVDSNALRLFDQFLATCKKNGTKVLLVYSPEYYETNKLVVNRDSLESIFRTYAQKYDVPYLDYTKDTICYSKNYFINSQHLNNVGAEIFTHHLLQDIKAKNLYP